VSFLRRKRDHDHDLSEADAAAAASGPAGAEADDAAESEQTTGWSSQEKPRPQGPFDIDDVTDDVTRIDFGALLVPAVDGMEIRLDVDDEGRVGAVAVVLDGTALQLQVFAAPRTLGLWDEIRAEMSSGIGGSGGKTEEVDGPFGPELRAQLPVAAPDGKQTVQPVRFLGVDGPRWFLRGVVTGPGGADLGAGSAIHDVFGKVAVVRGDTAAPPREPLLLTMPDDPALRPEAPAQPPRPTAP